MPRSILEALLGCTDDLAGCQDAALQIRQENVVSSSTDSCFRVTEQSWPVTS